VVRALPASATASWQELLADYNAALDATMKRLQSRQQRSAGTGPNGTTQEGTQRA
jgi:ribonuclease P protein component